MQGPEDRLPSPGPPGILPPREEDRGPGEKVARVCSELHALPRVPAASEAGPGLLRPRLPGHFRPRSAEEPGCLAGVRGAPPGLGRSPLTISTWRGSSWLGGAGTENWIFLRSLGSMAGGWSVGGARAAGSGAGVRGCGPGALLRAPRRQRAECGGEEQEGCSRTDKNTAPARGGGAGAGGGGRPPARLPRRAPGLDRALVPSRPHPGLPGSRVWVPVSPLLSSLSLSVAPPFLYLPCSLSACLSLSLPRSGSPGLTLRPQPWGAQPVPSAWAWRPGAWWEDSGDRGQ